MQPAQIVKPNLSAAVLDNPGRRGHNQKKFLQIFKLRRNRT